jgi:hypothetical protein
MGQNLPLCGQLGAARSRQDESKEVGGQVGSKRTSSGCNGVHHVCWGGLIFRLLRGEIGLATKTQKLRPISNCDSLLDHHVLPLAHFGAPPPTYVPAAWCGPITIMLPREVGALNTQQHDTKVQHASICWWLLKPITGQAPCTAATLE